MKISGLYGKKVGGAKDGYVISVNSAAGRLILVCADDDEHEFFVPFDGAEFGEKIVFGKECGKEKSDPVRLGVAAFDEDGRFLGRLEDITVVRGRLKTARIGKKNYPCEGLAFGDVIIWKQLPVLNGDVIKDGRTLFKKGKTVTREALETAAAEGEYVQTRLKSL